MRLHVLQHVPFEGPARIAEWAAGRHHALAVSHLYAGDPLPPIESFDQLIVMGGPMSVHDEAEYSWLASEKACIEDAIAAGRSVLGVCLGAQLIAQVLGAQVVRNPCKEIGWFPVEFTAEAKATPLCRGLPERFDAFHWHGERFGIPPDAVHLARSQACAQQAFLFDDRVLALQFHLESSPTSVAALCEHCADEIQPGESVQSAAEMCSAPERRYAQLNRMLEHLLDRLAPAPAVG